MVKSMGGGSEAHGWGVVMGVGIGSPSPWMGSQRERDHRSTSNSLLDC